MISGSLFIAFIVTLFLTGLVLTSPLLESLPTDKKNFPLYAISISLISGLSLHILSAHLLAFTVHSYHKALWISLALMLLLILLRIKKSLPTLRSSLPTGTYEYSVLLIALLFSAFMTFRDISFGTPDRIHFTLIASITNNNIYPPIYPVDQHLSMSFYHYGTDLITASIKSFCRFAVWDAASMQIGLGTFLSFLGLYSLLRFFLSNNTISLFMTLSVFLFTSINSIDFLIKEFPYNRGYHQLRFFKAWTIMSWTSVSHMGSQLRLLSQNIAFPLSFTLSYLILVWPPNWKLKSIYYSLIGIISFLLSFTYPTYWHVIFAASILFFGIKPIKDLTIGNRNSIMEFPLLIGSFFAGKILCFGSKHTTFNGINALIFSPSLEWVNWGKPYIKYFYRADYLSKLKIIDDPVTNGHLLSIPLFSSISFRDFGFSAILATLIFIYKIYKSKFDKSLLILLGAYISLTVSFLVNFIMRPVEPSRFLLWANILFLIFIAIHLGLLLEKFFIKRKFLSIAISFLVIVSLIPGFVSMLPYKKFAAFRKELPQDLKALAICLEKIHKSGDVVLDLDRFDIQSYPSGLAGFYGVGGEFLQDDLKTRDTAMKLLNPRLLSELNVNYVLTKADRNFNYPASERLKDPRLFKEIALGDKCGTYRLFKFLGAAENAPEEEYIWILGYADPDGFTILKSSNDQIFASHNRSELLKPKEELRKLIKGYNPVSAIWLREEAITSEEFQKVIGSKI
jgi:hypothetical protein